MQRLFVTEYLSKYEEDYITISTVMMKKKKESNDYEGKLLIPCSKFSSYGFNIRIKLKITKCIKKSSRSIAMGFSLNSFLKYGIILGRYF